MQASEVAVEESEDKTDREQLSLAVIKASQPLPILASCWDSDTLRVRLVRTEKRDRDGSFSVEAARILVSHSIL